MRPARARTPRQVPVRSPRTALRAIVRAQPVSQQNPLPLTHVSECIYLSRILIVDSEIRPDFCDIYNDIRLYTYYARPAARVRKEGPLHNLNFAPVGFLIDSMAAAAPRPVEVVALDTGALERELLWEAMHRDLSRQDFALDPSVRSAQSLAILGFGRERNYVSGTRDVVAAAIPQSPLDADVVAYRSVVSRGGNLDCDERATSIEVHFKDAIPVDGPVIAIILPEEFLDVPQIAEALKAKNVFPLPYQFNPDHTAKELAGTFYEKAAQYYSSQKCKYGWDW